MTGDCTCQPWTSIYRIDELGRPVRVALVDMGEPAIYSVVVEHDTWCPAVADHGTAAE